MKKLLRNSATVLLATAILTAPAMAKDPTADDKVAKVVSIEGKKMDYNRGGDGKWVAGKVDMAGFVKDHFRTDKSTSAAVELLIGGRIALKKDTEIVLISDGQAGTVEGNRVDKIVLNKGGAYAKFQKQDKPLTIQTRGGVMGIKGTEFGVQTGENGETEVTLVEGSVEYTEQDGQSTNLTPGEKMVQFEKDGELHTLTGEPEKVDKAADEFKSGDRPMSEYDSVKETLDNEYVQWASALLGISVDQFRGWDSANDWEKLQMSTDFVNSFRSGTINSYGIPSSVNSLISNFTGVNWSGWAPDLGINGISIPGIPSIPNVPRIGW